MSPRARAIHVIRAINPLEPHSRPFVGIMGPRSFIAFIGFAIGERVHEWTRPSFRKNPASLFFPASSRVSSLNLRVSLSSLKIERRRVDVEKLVSAQCRWNTLSDSYLWPLFQRLFSLLLCVSLSLLLVEGQETDATGNHHSPVPTRNPGGVGLIEGKPEYGARARADWQQEQPVPRAGFRAHIFLIWRGVVPFSLPVLSAD